MTHDDRVVFYTDPRVLLANERSFLSWIRAGSYIMGFGFLLTKLTLFESFLAPQFRGYLIPMTKPGHYFGGALSLVAVVFQIVALVRYRRNYERWHRGEDGTGANAPAYLGAYLFLLALLIMLYIYA